MANQPKGFSEFIRKRIVALKRKPQTIALIAFALAFVYYSLNLTKISDTTAYINLPGMGLAGFATPSQEGERADAGADVRAGGHHHLRRRLLSGPHH